MWRKIMRENLGLQPDERFVVLCDESPGVELPAEIVVASSTGGHGREPDREVWCQVFGAAAVTMIEMDGTLDRVIAKDLSPQDLIRLEGWADRVAPLAPDAVLAITHFSTSHTAFRRLLCRTGTRYASMPLFREDLLREGGPLDIDQGALVRRTRELARRLSGAKLVRVRNPWGTDLSFSVEGRAFHADDGDLTAPGSFGNLPAGEVYCAPVEGTGEGILAIAPGVLLKIREGRIVAVEGEHPIGRTFVEHPEHLLLAELGIGTNDRASRLDNVLEAEKILGTIHIAFGDNASFGGTQQIPYHQDHVLENPTIEVDGAAFALPEA